MRCHLEVVCTSVASFVASLEIASNKMPNPMPPCVRHRGNSSCRRVLCAHQNPKLRFKKNPKLRFKSGRPTACGPHVARNLAGPLPVARMWPRIWQAPCLWPACGQESGRPMSATGWLEIRSNLDRNSIEIRHRDSIEIRLRF